MSRFAAVVTLIIGGIIVADILTHPTGVKAAGTQINSIWGTTTRALDPARGR
jgi:hypothetical protein